MYVFFHIIYCFSFRPLVCNAPLFCGLSPISFGKGRACFFLISRHCKCGSVWQIKSVQLAFRHTIIIYLLSYYCKVVNGALESFLLIMI